MKIPTVKRMDSTKTKSSKISRIANPLKKASSKLDQKLEKLKSRVSNPEEAHKESEMPASSCTALPEAVKQSTEESKPTIEVKKTIEDDMKKARREARRAKWAGRRASLKRLAKKTGKAVALSGAVVLGIVFGPVIVIVDLAVSLVAIVIRLLLELVGLILAPFYICLVW